jgi:hypothetical protein
MARTDHLKKPGTEDALCGDRYGWSTRDYPFADHSLCPKCSSKWFAANQRPGWTLEKLAIPESYEAAQAHPWGLKSYGVKSAYLARHQGEPVAIIRIDTGWGESWYVQQLSGEYDDVNDPASIKITGGLMAQHYGVAGRDVVTGERKPMDEGAKRYPSDAKRFSSKERALWGLAEMMADGFLKPESVLRAETLERMIAHRQRLAERVIEDAQRERDREEFRKKREVEAQRAKDELDLIAMAFAEMVTEGKISNFQREAVFIAAKRLGIEGLDQA